MKRPIAALLAATALGAGAAAAPSGAAGSTLVQYSNCVGVLPGIAYLQSTAGFANRIFNHAATCLPTPPNRPLKIRNLLSGGGVVGEQGDVNGVQTNFASPYPYSKSRCWVPSGGAGGVLYCDTLTQ